VGHGLVFCGSSDHKVHALDAASGAPRWQSIGEGRVPVAPTLWRGRLFFSDDNGWVHCLRADQGETVWRFRAALGIERIVGYGDLMSRWPARTGVLVQGDTAYFAAGLFPDEGTAVYAVDARTGALRWEQDYSPKRRGSRTAGFVPDGALALAGQRLYVPAGAGTPWQVALDDPEHPASATPGYHVKGSQIMAVGQDVVAVTPGLQYVHHVQYKTGEAPHRLPVVTGDTVYLLNQAVTRTTSYLIAGKRDVYQLSQNRSAIFELKKGVPKTPEETWLRWKAWKDEPMTCLIEAGGTLFSGGRGKIYATAAATGKELWSAAVPGVVSDLAFHEGRLFVLCDEGTIVAFGKRP
jgi:outer membrane protein assembly factor BamB